MPSETIRIDGRFRGPPRSANGGYTCGTIANRLDGVVAVRLSAPPPLDTDLRLESSPDEAKLFHGERLLAVGKPAQLTLETETKKLLAKKK